MNTIFTRCCALLAIYSFVFACKQRHAQSDIQNVGDQDDSNWESYTNEALDRGGPYNSYDVEPTTAEPLGSIAMEACRSGKTGCQLGFTEPTPSELISGVAAPNQVSLFVMKSPKGIAWTSPRDLLNSTVSNSRGSPPHPIGHVMVELSCADNGKGQPAYILAGMSDVNAAQAYALLVAQAAGLDFLFHSFQGRLQTDSEIRADLFRYMNNATEGPRLAQLTHLISAETCQRLVTYFDAYKEKGIYQHFGLSLRPLYQEGSGCSAFGVSFLQVAGLVQSDFDALWQTAVAVPYRFMKSGRIEEGRILRRAPVRRIEMFGGSWAESSENSRTLRFWNPDLIHQWITAAHRSETYQALTHGGAGRVPIVVIDATKTKTPTGSIFLSGVLQ